MSYVEIRLIRTALGLHQYNSAQDYLLKARLRGETRESYVIAHDNNMAYWPGSQPMKLCA